MHVRLNLVKPCAVQGDARSMVAVDFPVEMRRLRSEAESIPAPMVSTEGGTGRLPEFLEAKSEVNQPAQRTQRR